MLRSLKELNGYSIRATDGPIGRTVDFFFDDHRWIVRYLVVDTTNWRPGGRVLVAPQWIRDVRWSDSEVVVDLTRENIRRSPAYNPAEPVNEEYERRLYDYYGRPRL